MLGAGSHWQLDPNSLSELQGRRRGSSQDLLWRLAGVEKAQGLCTLLITIQTSKIYLNDTEEAQPCKSLRNLVCNPQFCDISPTNCRIQHAGESLVDVVAAPVIHLSQFRQRTSPRSQDWHVALSRQRRRPSRRSRLSTSASQMSYRGQRMRSGSPNSYNQLRLEVAQEKQDFSSSQESMCSRASRVRRSVLSRPKPGKAMERYGEPLRW